MTHKAMALLGLLGVLQGCQTMAIQWGNLAALGITVSLFWGTLQLGRRPLQSDRAGGTPVG